MSKSREAFSAGVIAIIIAVMVLETKVPGENNFAPWPMFFYWAALFFSGFAYILERLLVSAHGDASKLVRAIGQDLKPKISVLMYLVAIGLAFFSAFPTLAQSGPPVRLGAISGSLSYPSDEIPALEVYAYQQGTWTKFQKIVTAKGQTSFLISGVVPGTYVLVAYPLGEEELKGGYSKAVPCGLHAACKDHSLIPVQVTNGASVGGVELKDWYAPPGSFPPRPK